MRELILLYDRSCAICVRCRRWMERQRAYVRVTFLAADSEEARARFGAIPWLGDELVAVSDRGEVWAGPAAFLLALWALEDYREWSFRLSGETTSRLAERFFAALSHRRRWLAGWLAHEECASGRCHALGPHATSPYR